MGGEGGGGVGVSVKCNTGWLAFAARGKAFACRSCHAGFLGLLPHPCPSISASHLTKSQSGSTLPLSECAPLPSCAGPTWRKPSPSMGAWRSCWRGWDGRPPSGPGNRVATGPTWRMCALRSAPSSSSTTCQRVGGVSLVCVPRQDSPLPASCPSHWSALASHHRPLPDSWL